MTSETMISVCICCHNSSARVEDTLLSLAMQTADHGVSEIIVIDNASKDSGALLAIVEAVKERFPVNIKVIQEKVLGLSHARNAGVRNGSGRYIYFIDDDAVANPRLIEHLISAINEYKPDVIGGNILPLFEIQPPNEFDYRQWPSWSIKHFGGKNRWLENDEYFIGTNIGAKRSLLIARQFSDELGRKGNVLTGGEEWFLGSSKYRKYFSAGAYVLHKVSIKRMTPEYLARRRYSLYKQLGQHTGIGWFIKSVVGVLIIRINISVKRILAEVRILWRIRDYYHKQNEGKVMKQHQRSRNDYMD